MNNSSQKRLIKNTIFMYLRMTIMMAVGFFTSRVVLHTLGAEDFGIYNVVAGVVILFSVITGAIQNATSRFINIELARKDDEQANKVFCTALNIHIVLALIIFILGETVGLWFLNTKLNIPADRMNAANLVYQFSIFTTAVSIVTLPYNASIIAHERLDFYALQSIIMGVLKLIIVYLLIISSFDKLVVYGILMFVVGIINLILVKFYCQHQFMTTHYRKIYDKTLFKGMFIFSSWSLLSNLGFIANTQGINMILNMFYGVKINAALGVANQVNAAVSQFYGNFSQAFTPQIMQSYVNDKKYFIKLLFVVTKISFFLMLFISLPVVINIDWLLNMWLGKVPEYSNKFGVLYMNCCLLTTITGTLWRAMQAYGNIRNYELIHSCFIFTNLPIVYCLSYFEYNLTYVIAVQYVVFLFITIWHIFYLRSKVDLPSWQFFLNVFCRCFATALLAAILPFWVHSKFAVAWQGFIASGFASVFSVLFWFWILGFTPMERKYILEKVMSQIKRITG